MNVLYEEGCDAYRAAVYRHQQNVEPALVMLLSIVLPPGSLPVERLEKRGDLWKDILNVKSDLAAKISGKMPE